MPNRNLLGAFFSFTPVAQFDTDSRILLPDLARLVTLFVLQATSKKSVHCTTYKEDPQFHAGSSAWIAPDGSAEIQLKRLTWDQGTVTHSVGSSFQFRTSDGHAARCSGSLLGSPSYILVRYSALSSEGHRVDPMIETKTRPVTATTRT